LEARKNKKDAANDRHPRGNDVDRGPASKRRHITEREVEDIEERSSPRTPVIYEIVCRLGEDEMVRPAASLWWSGVAAGLSISFSLLAQAILQTHLPDAPWRPLVTSLGYSVGFIMVVLSRQQLFTETTITVVLPVMSKLTVSNLGLLGRMWAIVLIANLAGTFFAAAFCSFTPVLTPELKAAMIEISRHTMDYDLLPTFLKAITAGFLMAAMVWLLPSAEAAQVHVVALMTYLIAVGGSMHIVAGSMETFMLLANGQLGLLPMLSHFTLPVLAGNVVGGTALFALISYAQVMKEI
jgi:formate/nitrite transporter FocA (FNT family)